MVAVMIQGTGSNVGKSTLVAGVARALCRRGLSVAPFKPQNMSNNAAVTADGGEIGRAQALQAQACGLEPLTSMNPVLLKPESEIGAQVVVNGKRLTTVKAREYTALKPQLMPPILESYQSLAAQHDLILIEGAGSPAETNLRENDLANMGFAKAADVPVILAGDIDRGGVIAQMVGTHQVLDAADRARIKGFLINKFRGDVSLFDEGLAEITRHTGWHALGVCPWFADAHLLPAEDAFDIRSTKSGRIKVAVPRLSRIANFDDLDPLKNDPNVQVEMIAPGSAIPGDADLIFLAGSKSTTAEIAYFREQGWDIDLAAHIRRGGYVLGVCGGYQMLGKLVHDPQGIEGTRDQIEGLGHLDIETVMTPDKTLTNIDGRDRESGAPFSGYEIHIGKSSGPDCTRAWLEIDGRAEGAASPSGRVMGTYLHGLLASDAFRDAYLKRLTGIGTQITYDAQIEETLDRLATHIEAHIDLDHLLEIARAG